MNYKAIVYIMPHAELLDPQGKAVKSSLEKLSLCAINDVRVGKRIDLSLIAESKSDAEEMVEEACKKLLANQIMESYSFELQEI